MPFVPPQASSFAPHVDALYGFMIAVTAFFSILIGTLVVVFAIKYHRKSPDEVATEVHESGALEIAWTIIPECRVPQNSAQKRWYFPGSVASNHAVEKRPGTTSRLKRNAGTKKEWITSSEAMVSRMGRSTGTCSSFISRCPSECWIFHIHCLPVT